MTELQFSHFWHKRYVQVFSLIMIVWAIMCSWQLVSAYMIFTGSLVLCVIQLALLETLYRRANSNKWQYKPLVLGFTICVLFDFILFAESALFAQVNNQLWSARGFVYAAMVPLLIISVRRIQAWGINVYISRDIVLQSSLVFAAGVYLSLIAIAGFYIRYIGGQWSHLIQATFLVLGFAMLAVLLFSGAVRRQLRVYIEKHFFANKFDYRQKWLELTRHLRQIDISQPDQYQTILKAWLDTIGYSRGCIIRYTQGQNFIPLARYERAELNTAETQLITRYAATFADKYWLVDLQDPADAFVQQLSNRKTIDAQLAIPIQSEGELWGLCLLNAPDVNQLNLNWELRDFLMLVSEQVGSYLLLMQASETLSENAQFAAFSRMSAFVVHDLKNVKAQLDLLLKNSIKHRHNPEFIDDSFTTLAAMQLRLNNMLQQLSSKRSQSSEDSIFSVNTVISQVVSERCATKLPLPSFTATAEVQLSLNKERFASVIYHLIDNAQHATEEQGEVQVTLAVKKNHAIISISDTGYGMSEEFIRLRLFKPFDSTKGNSGMGVGAYDAQQFAAQHQGELLVSSTLAVGTTFTLMLPLH
ncbi:XrtA/PEP-CTERM system histidine kinase PrsK [Rheinheimera salexigens]|uniref:histidine kinase n=1 Tax=Rheinheimera salexigens TaxID=1628148 RepID=A0A1E7Q5N5_9GAMM|nr:XrtA/PEP-CTERM system histidine kinase PrsK [Rheinheimera salexigens]OEY69467.1 histidine kinase [Rheinheimera salexigens]